MSVHYYTFFRYTLISLLQRPLDIDTIIFSILLMRKTESHKKVYNLHMVTSQQGLEQE